jgi:hypothetical protein
VRVPNFQFALFTSHFSIRRPLTLGFGLWALDLGPWTLDLGPWTLDLGPSNPPCPAPAYSPQKTSLPQIPPQLPPSQCLTPILRPLRVFTLFTACITPALSPVSRPLPALAPRPPWNEIPPAPRFFTTHQFPAPSSQPPAALPLTNHHHVASRSCVYASNAFPRMNFVPPSSVSCLLSPVSCLPTPANSVLLTTYV